MYFKIQSDDQIKAKITLKCLNETFYIEIKESSETMWGCIYLSQLGPFQLEVQVLSPWSVQLYFSVSVHSTEQSSPNQPSLQSVQSDPGEWRLWSLLKPTFGL